MIPQKKPHKENMIESRMIGEQNNNPAVNNHFRLQIKMLLQNAPRRDADRSEWLLQVKEEMEKEREAIHT
jgi:hypothetical protein